MSEESTTPPDIIPKKRKRAPRKKKTIEDPLSLEVVPESVDTESNEDSETSKKRKYVKTEARSKQWTEKFLAGREAWIKAGKPPNEAKRKKRLAKEVVVATPIDVAEVSA